MSTDQPPQVRTENASKHTRWVVGTIGGLLVVVVSCGLLLRGLYLRQPAEPTEGNLTSVTAEPALTGSPEESDSGGQPATITSTERVAQVDPPTPQPDDDSSGAIGEDAPREMGASQADAATTDSVSSTFLATLDPVEIDGLATGPEGPWQPASLAGKQYERALCMVRASGVNTSQISFALRGKYRQLSGIAGLQDAPNGDLSSELAEPEAVFRIYGDANLLWDSAPQTIAGATVPFQLDVQGLDYLSLVVEYGARDDGAEPAWADLQLIPTASGVPPSNESVSEP